MDVEEIEAIYKQDIEKAEKEFLEGIAKKKKVVDLEKKYFNKFKIAKKKYYKSMSAIIEKQKKYAYKKPLQKKAPDKSKAFKANTEEIRLTPYQKMRFKWDLFKFKFRLKLKKFFRAITPTFISYLFIKFRLFLKRTYNKLKEMVKSFFTFIKESILWTINSIETVTKKTYKFFTNILKNIWKIFKLMITFPFKKRKEKPSEKESKSEQEDSNSGQNKE
jgi:hypothetical protein